MTQIPSALMHLSHVDPVYLYLHYTTPEFIINFIMISDH